MCLLGTLEPLFSFLETFSLLFWQHDVEPDLVEKYPHHLGILFTRKATSEENILKVLQFPLRGITLPGIRNDEC